MRLLAHRFASLVQLFQAPCARASGAKTQQRRSPGRRHDTSQAEHGRTKHGTVGAHGFQCTKFRYTRSPASALFSARTVLVFGEVTTPNGEQQDFVLVRSDGVPLYNFGAVVDDLTMEVTLVARGRDHMVNTPPQVLLYEAFGVPVPAFAHLPMMLAPSGEKLSKRHGAVSVSEYRDQGYSPHAVLNYLARFGWSHGDQEVFSMQELVAAFSWEACGRGDGKFDPKKFLAIQQEHLKAPRLTPDAGYNAWQGAIHEGLSRFLYKKTKRRPLILPLVTEV